MDEEYEDWMICFHSSGNEPGCVGCWYGTAQRVIKENKRLRKAVDLHRNLGGWCAVCEFKWPCMTFRTYVSKEELELE